jgi:hypothetical protein
MRCSNPYCNRGIGLLAHRRGWFSRRRYCSRNCHYAFVAVLPKRSREQSVSTYFEWLFLQPIGARSRSRSTLTRAKGSKT